MNRKIAALVIIIVFMLIIVFPAANKIYHDYEAEAYGESQIGRTPCNIMIYLYSGSTYALNCQPPFQLLSSSATNPENVFNAAINSLDYGGIIFVTNGTYTFQSAAINMGAAYAAIGTSTGRKNIELYGEGNSTVLTQATNLDASIIGVEGGAYGWYVHDLQINGNRVNQNGNGLYPNQQQAIFYVGDGLTIERCYIHDFKTYGLQTVGSQIRILNNHVVNSNANGMTLLGSRYEVENNFVDGASDVGISVQVALSGAIVADNSVYNINLGVSPYDLNSGDAIFVGDGGPSNNVTVSGNTIYGNTDGIVLGGGNNLIASNNQVASSTIDGIVVGSSVSGVIVEANVIRSSGAAGIAVQPGSIGVQVLDNTIPSPLGNGIQVQSSSVIAGNVVEQSASWGTSSVGIEVEPNTVNVIVANNIVVDYGGYAAYLYSASNCVLIGNQFYDDYGPVVLYGTGTTNNLIEDNVISGYKSPNYKTAIYVDTTASETTIVDNDLLNNTYPISSSYLAFTITAPNMVIKNNLGYNPVGYIASPLSSSGNYITDSGSGSSWTSGTTYTNWQSPKILYLSGGTVSAIVVDGQTLYTSAASVAITLQPGDTFSVTFSSAPTINVLGM